MAYNYNKTSNTCATCIYWQGQRDIDYGGRVTVQTSNMYGKCAMGVYSPNSAGQNAGNSKCSKFQLHPSVK